MELAGSAQTRFGAERHRARVPWQHLDKWKARAGLARRLGQIAAHVFGLFDGAVVAADVALDVAEHKVDPVRTLDLGRGAATFSYEHPVRVWS